MIKKTVSTQKKVSQRASLKRNDLMNKAILLSFENMTEFCIQFQLKFEVNMENKAQEIQIIRKRGSFKIWAKLDKCKKNAKKAMTNFHIYNDTKIENLMTLN